MTIPTWEQSWGVALNLVGIGFAIYFVFSVWVWMIKGMIQAYNNAFSKPQNENEEEENNNASDSYTG